MKDVKEGEGKEEANGGRKDGIRDVPLRDDLLYLRCSIRLANVIVRRAEKEKRRKAGSEERG